MNSFMQLSINLIMTVQKKFVNKIKNVDNWKNSTRKNKLSTKLSTKPWKKWIYVDNFLLFIHNCI